MKSSFTFKRIKGSENVQDYANDKINRLQKFEIRPSQAKFIFSSLGHEPVCEIIVVGFDQRRFVAKSTGTNLYDAIDLAIDKIERQMEKLKDRVKSHKHLTKTKSFHLENCLNESLEVDFTMREKGRKAA